MLLAPPSWLELAEASRRAGVSKDALRRRIRAGQLVGRKFDSLRGPSKRVRAADLASVAPAAAVAAIVDRRPKTVALLRSAMVPAAELVALVERQQQTILERSGLVGWLQAQLEQARQTIRPLEAPKEAPAPSTEPPRHHPGFAPLGGARRREHIDLVEHGGDRALDVGQRELVPEPEVAPAGQVAALEPHAQLVDPRRQLSASVLHSGLA